MLSKHGFNTSVTYTFVAVVYLLGALASGEISHGLLFGLQQRSAGSGDIVPRASGTLPAGAGSPLEPSTVAIDTALEAKIEEIINTTPHDRAEWGIEVLSLDDNRVVYAHNANQPMIPASNVKLFTTAAAMHYLGPQYRFKTAVYAHPSIRPNGTLQGDLVLRGGGDPFFSKNFLAHNAQSFFEQIAQQLRNQGIQRIAGNIIGDDSLYPYAPPPTSALASSATEAENGWTAGDSENSTEEAEEDLSSGAISALSFNDNLVGVRAVPIRVGRKVQVSTEPETSYFKIINRATAGSGRRSTLRLTRLKGTNTIVLSGRLPMRSRGFYGYVKVDDPASFAAYVLKESLERVGITVSGASLSHHRGGIPYREMRELARYDSPPLIEAINVINKQSLNTQAELLLRLVGTEVRGSGTTEAGISVIRSYLTEAGIDPGALVISDGSGLSRNNVLSPHAEISLLRYVASQNYYPHFVSSLPVAGVDGTLKSRLAGMATAQRVFGKTGTLGNVVALGGFMYPLGGRRLAFVIFCNNFARGAGAARQAVDKIMELLAQHEYHGSESTGVRSLSQNSATGPQRTLRMKN